MDKTKDSIINNRRSQMEGRRYGPVTAAGMTMHAGTRLASRRCRDTCSAALCGSWRRCEFRKVGTLSTGTAGPFFPSRERKAVVIRQYRPTTSPHRMQCAEDKPASTRPRSAAPAASSLPWAYRLVSSTPFRRHTLSIPLCISHTHAQTYTHAYAYSPSLGPSFLLLSRQIRPVGHDSGK